MNANLIGKFVEALKSHIRNKKLTWIDVYDFGEQDPESGFEVNLDRLLDEIDTFAATFKEPPKNVRIGNVFDWMKRLFRSKDEDIDEAIVGLFAQIDACQNFPKAVRLAQRRVEIDQSEVSRRPGAE